MATTTTTFNVPVFGNVDAGKSTLVGHLMVLTGTVPQEEYEKVKRLAQGKDKSFSFAWLLDIDDDEREICKTQESHPVVIEWKGCPEKKICFVDTPGHQQYVRAMISGLSDTSNVGSVAARTGLLVVSAHKGEFKAAFEGKYAQTKEHLVLARCVGLETLVVAVNKMDDAKWERDAYDRIVSDLSAFLKSIGWPKSSVHYIPVAAYPGTGLVDAAGLPGWYAGSGGLMQLLTDSHPGPPRRGEELSGARELPCRAKVHILRDDSIVSAGFSCVLHCGGVEVSVELLSLEPAETKARRRPFVRAGGAATCTINALQLGPKLVLPSARFILRKDNYTVGFGKWLQ